MNILELIDIKLKTQSISDIMTELRLDDIVVEKLYEELFDSVKNKRVKIDNIKYTPQHVNKNGIVFMYRILQEIHEGNYVCGGIGYQIHINELIQ